MSNEHTATLRPWTTFPTAREWGPRLIGRDGHPTVATVGGNGETRDQRDANAALIVRAVNAHDALVKALEEAMNAVAYASNFRWKQDKKLDKAYESARAALALAKGESK